MDKKKELIDYIFLSGLSQIELEKIVAEVKAQIGTRSPIDNKRHYKALKTKLHSLSTQNRELKKRIRFLNRSLVVFKAQAAKEKIFGYRVTQAIQKEMSDDFRIIRNNARLINKLELEKCNLKKRIQANLFTKDLELSYAR